MKVALAHDHLNQVGGAERVLFEFHKMYPEAPVFTLLYDQGQVGDYFKDWDIKSSFIQDTPGGFKFFKWFLPLMPTAVERFDFSQYDLVITSASGLIKGILVKPQSLNVCYCHTPTRYLWSDTHSYTSELPQPKIVKKILPIILSKLRMWDYIAAQRVDHFVANSKFVQKRIAKYYRRDSQIIYPPVDVKMYNQLAEPEDYFLIISRLRPYKRVDMAIKAFNKLNIPLKVIGGGEQLSELKAMANDNIEFLGEISDVDKAHYLARCRALIHPQEEDFGITAVEALASGRPVIAYQAGGALEIIKDDISGKFFTDQSWESLADAVIRFRYQMFNPEVVQKEAQKFSIENFKTNWSELIDKL